ncbi:IQ motif, EF-hand binding site [Corchorus capsularis]|uniref:IQ motif, EF-hand binding site n=1 Tax=Corchorus capsularis TaxID=210143 RepID=A0A1R3GG95_COCAP|nr:IQ motif, EF-hand binding site [Corchorus capsularis]
MDFPFYGNAWNASSRPRYAHSFRRSPVEVHPKVTTPPPQVVKPKVVSIPVHFVGSEQRVPDSSDSAVRSVGSERSRFDPSHSAVKIQKVFRGFLVRKSMKKIKAIREEVNDIERRVSNKETVDLLRNDSKERLKVNEMLMSLLFKLDSVRGVDSGVRDCRKSVIKKAIALQELVDAIVSGQQSLDSNNDNDEPSPDSNNADETPTQQTQDEITNDAEFMPNFSESEVIHETVESSKEMVDNQELEEASMETSQTESQTDSSANPENVADEEEESKEETNNNSNKEESVENKRSKELLMRMMEDNDKMLGLMAKLFERNEQQMQMLSSLSQRVEQLEKAFLCEKLRRKKRRSAADCVERSPDLKKCGKR